MEEDNAPTKPPTTTTTLPERRKSSVAKVVSKILYNPNKKNVYSVEAAAANLEDDSKTPSSKFPSNQFRFYRGGHGSDHRVVQLSADSLLSIVSEFCLYYSQGGVAGGMAVVRRSSVQTSRRASMAFAVPPFSSVEVAASKISLDPASVTVRKNI